MKATSCRSVKWANCRWNILIMNGYLDEPDLTRAAFADDFFRTGDLARIRDDGLMELTGRAKELTCAAVRRSRRSNSTAC